MPVFMQEVASHGASCVRTSAFDRACATSARRGYFADFCNQSR